MESPANRRIAVSGATGLIGSALVPLLKDRGHEVQRLRREAPYRFVLENPALPPEAVIHLAGESITGRWTADKKTRIRASRVEGTENLCRLLRELPRPPRVLLCASAVGYYGSRGEEILDESSPPGEGFLAEVCRGWEAAAESARQSGIRVVTLRFGMILSPHGGALARMLAPFRLGLGGRIGDGRQFYSWISLDDALGAMYSTLVDERFAGPVNVVAPEPVTNAELTAALGRVLRRPAILPFPAPLVKTFFGEMGEALLLASARVLPRRLSEGGCPFRHPRLENALRRLLEKVHSP
ncbi:MAG: TIGR01777 family oxidoreductase [Pirellulales bacterium]|nr:TIGR01777 family oxidoreductase [Pirellulales bacterium]